MNNILVIGGDSYIAKQFLSNTKNKNIKVISRVETGFNNEIILSDLFKINSNYFKDIDIVISFIGIVHKKETEKNKDLYYTINRDLSCLLAKTAKENDVNLFIQMSTIAVYGEQNQISIDSVESPSSHYGKSKLQADKLLLGLQSEFFKVLIIRPTMIYGINAPGNFGKLEKIVRLGFLLPFKGLNNQRFFLYIKNFILMLDELIEDRSNGIVILSDDKSLSTYQLIQIMALKWNKEKRIIDHRFIKFVVFVFFKKYYKKIFSDLIIYKNKTYSTRLYDSYEALKIIYNDRGEND